MQNLPTPLEGSTVGNKQLDAFQENINTASQGIVRVPWLPTTNDVRQSIESQAATPEPQGKYRANGPLTVGQNIQLPHVPGLSRVTKVYENGTFDASQ